MLPIIEKEVVDKKKWMDKEEFIDMLALAQTVPGPVSVNTAIFAGYKTRGIWGGLVAMAGTVIPSFVIILLIALFFMDVKENPVIERIFKGIRPAVVAMIAAPVWRMALSAGVTWKTAVIPIAAALLIWLLGVSPSYILIGAVLGGIIYGFSRS